jgi:hypothetical protein
MATEIITQSNEYTEWKTKISDAWQRSVGSVVEVGKLIRAAKTALGVSYNLLETELPFSPTVAAYLVKIAEHPVLSNPDNFSRLPSAYNTLYHLASVDEAKLIEQLDNGEITPDYGLASAKALREISPNVKTSLSASKKSKQLKYSVGTISIAAPENVDDFQRDLSSLLKKYDGEINYTTKQQSLAELGMKSLHELSLKNITEAESELTNISMTDLRILEDAAHYLNKPKSQSYKIQIVINDELVERIALPPSYKDYKRVCEILETEAVTKARLKKHVIENKIPNQFTVLSNMDKKLYVWEQVRLITDNKDVKGGIKKLKDLASRSTIPEIKELAAENLRQLTRFSNKV